MDNTQWFRVATHDLRMPQLSDDSSQCRGEDPRCVTEQMEQRWEAGHAQRPDGRRMPEQLGCTHAATQVTTLQLTLRLPGLLVDALEVDGAPVGASRRKHVGIQGAVLAERLAAQSNSAVLAAAGRGCWGG